ncbi:MAG: phenylalanine--tRNA ligase subunit beta [Methanomicrobiales archaeon]|jgi:phenylalanyl-tRNA synthetase beta chain|nr:phenylalanine--tRNA ligase subunit beta [Methanomicrobiales archaeon]
MPIISLSNTYLKRLCGIDKEAILSVLPKIGSDIERIEEEHIDTEFFPDRPDLYSTEGVARAIRGYLGIETGEEIYTTTDSGITFTLDENIKSIRPYFGTAVIRDLNFDNDAILSLMGLQEALHWVLGRGRKKVSIGVHNLDVITPPFFYHAVSPDTSFVPLEMEKELTMREILELHPKGRDYAHIVSHLDLFPIITDAHDQVLSFPPIINGELTKVTADTKNLLLDVTGTDERAVTLSLNILCASLMSAGGRCERVRVDDVLLPNLNPSVRSVSVDECNALLGLSLTPDEMITILEKMRFGAELDPTQVDHVLVRVPCYRADIMHDWDVFEDVGIGYGYENIPSSLPSVATIGAEHPIMSALSRVRMACTGLGYIEVMPFTLTNTKLLFDAMRRPPHPGVLSILHPIREEQSVFRTDILPSLLDLLRMNKHRELPQRLFCVGDVVIHEQTLQKLALVSTHPGADFSESYAVATSLCHELGIEHIVQKGSDPAYIEGRLADIIHTKTQAVIGQFGEIHPDVLREFDIDQPVAAFEVMVSQVLYPFPERL